MVCHVHTNVDRKEGYIVTNVKVLWRMSNAVEFLTRNGTKVQAITSPGSDYGGVFYAFWSEDRKEWWGYGKEREVGLDDFIARFERD
jgi:hypothetical protein